MKIKTFCRCSLFPPGQAKDLSAPLYAAETWTLPKKDTKYLESFKMLSWRRMEFCWTDHVINGSTAYRQGGEVKWIGHILRRNCLLKHVIAGAIEAWIV